MLTENGRRQKEGEVKSEKWEEKAYAFFQDILEYYMFQDIKACISEHVKYYGFIKGPEDKSTTLCSVAFSTSKQDEHNQHTQLQ